MLLATPALVIGGLSALLSLALLVLLLRHVWSWPAKASAIVVALPATIGTYLAVEAQTGWPSAAPLPHQFQLHAVLVEEPIAGKDEQGAIFLWVSPWDRVDAAEPEVVDVDALAAPLPRAFALPYSRELHKKVEAMRESLARGEVVTGRMDADPGWQRRFGHQDGTISLDNALPPPLPPKEG
jgi:hypothetical protein